MTAPRAALPPLSPNAWLRYELLRDLLASVPSASSFLEIGCGMGGLAARLVERYEYVGYEPDARSYETARSRLAGRGVVVNGVLPSAPDRTFDAVGAFEVLEHLEDDRASLAAWREWIRPGGHVLLSVPAHQSRYGAADAAVGHYRRYGRPDLMRLFRACGFDQATVWSYGFPLGYALELARNVLAPRGAADAYQRRTAASGRFYQPNDRVAWLTRLGTAPFRLMQRPFRETTLGTGLIAVARRPE
jgi:SAM-dependent methyltransferase